MSAASRYAQSQNLNVAYQVLGRGEIDLLECSDGAYSIDAVDEEPHFERFERRLAKLCRLIRFDRRGIGLSDPVDPAVVPTVEHWMDDAVAVLDAAGSERAAVYGSGVGGLPAILLAAAHPERVAALVLVNTCCRYARASDYLAGAPRQVLDALREAALYADRAAAIRHSSLAAPSLANDGAFRQWWLRAGQVGASPAVARGQIEALFSADLRSVLPSIHAPTLVLHRAGDNLFPVAHGRYLSQHITDVRYVELPGSDHLPWAGDAAAVLREVEVFLTGAPLDLDAERVLATLLFTDLVSSTHHAARAGDRAWRDILDQHDRLIRGQLIRFGGHEIQHTGDGFLARFDGPSRAIGCAHMILAGVRQLGLEARAGVHTGECEVRDQGLMGLAVHVASRICSLAGTSEVLVSSTVRDLIVGSSFTFEDRGEHTLRGVPGAWRLFVALSRESVDTTID
jgi:class 3 adenylate cyclase